MNKTEKAYQDFWAASQRYERNMARISKIEKWCKRALLCVMAVFVFACVMVLVKAVQL